MRAGVLGLLVCVATGGCATYEARPIEPARAEADFRARTLAEPGLRAFLERNGAAAEGPWTLERLTLAALYWHPDLDVARARVRVAEGAVETAGGRPNPVLALTPDYALNPEFGTTPYTLGFSLDVPIETAGKRGKRIDQAERAADARRLELGEAAWRVRSRLRAALAEHLLAKADADALLVEERQRADVRALLEARLAAGDASVVEVHVARADLAAATLAARGAEARVTDTRLALAQAIGVPPGALEGAAIAWDDLERPPAAAEVPLERIQKAGLVNRLDVRRSLAEYAAAEAALRLEVAKQYPDVHFNPGYLYEQGQHRISYGFSFELPVLNRNEGPIAEAAARREEAAALFLALQADAIAEIERGRARYAGALSSLAAAETILEEQLARQRGAERAFAVGDADRVTLAVARVEASAARRARIDALRQAQAALGGLEDAVQHPLASAPEPPAPEPASPRGGRP